MSRHYQRAQPRPSRQWTLPRNPKLLQEQAEHRERLQEQEEDRKGESWEVTEQEIDERALNYYREECDPLEEPR